MRDRNPLDSAPPLRTFTIGMRYAGWFRTTVVTTYVEGHVPQVLGDGSLQIVEYKRDIPWTVRLFAAGEWVSLDGDVPSDEDIDQLEAYNTRYGQKQQMMARSSKTAH